MNKTCISQLNLDLISLLCKADELECFHKDMNISILLRCTSRSEEQGTQIITHISLGLAKLCADLEKKTSAGIILRSSGRARPRGGGQLRCRYNG